MKNHISFCIVILFIITTSCSVNHRVAEIYSGNISETPEFEKSTGEVRNLGDNETFASYQKDNTFMVSPSNEIEFVLKQKERVKKSRKKNKIKRVKRGKKQYAFVDVQKYFYKFQIWRPIVGAIAIPLSYTTSLFYYPPTAHTKKIKVYEQLKEGDMVERTLYQKRILIETRIWCKKDQIHDNVVVIENLPEGITVDDYKVKVKRGKKRVKDVQYTEKQNGEKKFHEFTIIPSDEAFRKKNKIWIILDVTIKPDTQHKIK